ncbi:MAG TPA: ABC transporter substrate-binding protein/permease [Thermoanaerobaculia bacterium]|nr:ABC transporter substrate-binding protein/permease [Thermoanaerobaculia bacterium]
MFIAHRSSLIALLALLWNVAASAQQPTLRWGGDSEGGAPFVEADPNDPQKVMGFDVEVAEEIARALGRKPQFVQVSFAAIDQSVQRGDFDIGLSGVEDTPARRAALAASIPYYTFTEALTVREADKAKYDELADLRGRRVGTLGGTIAYDLLLEAEKKFGLEAVSYDDQVHPYEDVANGRLDAVLLDNIIAMRAMLRTKGLYTHFDKPVAKGHYIIVTARGNEQLRDQVNEILKARMRDGTLERIYRKWEIWDEYQQPFFNSVLMTNVGRASARPAPAKNDGLKPVLRYAPALLRAALVTIAMSCLSMALAVIVGMLVATSRVYGNALVRGILTAYVEIVRGTPVLLQLFVLYYGLSSVVKLPAFVAAMIGLGLNYAAYESEIYRGAMEAISRSQLEAARTLGLTELQVFRFVRGPQAFRLALAPMTNDFVALLKDSSLVSVITVVELTKQTQIFAANVGSWAIPGAICAALYLAMSLPLARLARHMEGRWKAAGV